MLDLGCGSGMSGAVIAAAGHAWVGCDISLDMLAVATGITPEVAPALRKTLTSAQQTYHLKSAQQQQQPAPSVQPSKAANKSRTGFNSLNHKPLKAFQHSSSSRGHGLVLWSDMAQGIPCRTHSLDGAISISAVQWLCHLPEAEKALSRLFKDLFRCLKPCAKAVLQVYVASEHFFAHHPLHLALLHSGTT